MVKLEDYWVQSHSFCHIFGCFDVACWDITIQIWSQPNNINGNKAHILSFKWFTFVHQKKYLNIVQLMFIKIIFNQSKEGGISRLVVARVKYASDIHIKKINWSGRCKCGANFSPIFFNEPFFLQTCVWLLDIMMMMMIARRWEEQGAGRTNRAVKLYLQHRHRPPLRSRHRMTNTGHHNHNHTNKNNIYNNKNNLNNNKNNTKN